MSAIPSHAPVTYLEAVPSGPLPAPSAGDEALTELALALDTQRSANRAMLEAVKELDRKLASQRELNGELTDKARYLEAQMAEYAAAVTDQVADNKRLGRQLRLSEDRLVAELGKPAWRRLLGR